MDVKFTNTTSSKLNNVAITNGQLIALSDKPGLYYDLGGVRRNVTPLSISDSYTSSAGTAASKVAASSYAVNQAYLKLLAKIEKIQFTFKEYDVTTTANSVVSPYGAYAKLDLTEEVKSYGNIIAVSIQTPSTNPGAAAKEPHYIAGSKTLISAWTMKPGACHVDVIYLTNFYGC